MAPIHPSQIGGGRVARSFNLGSRRVMGGTQLSRDEILGMAYQNRNSLIEKGFLVVWPPGTGAAMPSQAPTEPAGEPAERHVVSLGFGRYDVVEGRKLNDGPLAREDAYRLAGVAMPDVKRGKGQDQEAPN